MFIREAMNRLQFFRRREVGLIYQFYNLIPVLNVEENMSLPVLLDGRNVNRDRLRELIRELDLVGREKHLRISFPADSSSACLSAGH